MRENSNIFQIRIWIELHIRPEIFIRLVEWLLLNSVIVFENSRVDSPEFIYSVNRQRLKGINQLGLIKIKINLFVDILLRLARFPIEFVGTVETVRIHLFLLTKRMGNLLYLVKLI